MNIGLLTPYFPDSRTVDSGIGNHVLLLAESLAEGKNKVVVIHIRGAYPEETDTEFIYLMSDHITVITFTFNLPHIFERALKNRWALNDFIAKARAMFRAKKELKKIISEYDLDIIETTSYFTLGYFLANRIGKTPMVVRVSTTFSQIMNDHYPFKSRLLKFIAELEIRFIKKSKYLITHAHSHAEELEFLYQIDRKRFTIISHGVRLPALTDNLKSESVPVKVLYVGRLEYRKGIDVLLKAIPLILQNNPHVTFEIIGADTNDDYQKKFKAENSYNTVINTLFRGKADGITLANAYRDCDIFVAPSRYESFGIIYIEAMSFGKPVIGCKVGGVSTIIEHGFNGYFSLPGDTISLVETIERLVNHQEKRIHMGQNARKTVENKFTGKQLAERSLAYYNLIIKNHT